MRSLDLVRDVRNHLYGVAEILAPPLLRDHLGVDLAGRDIRLAGQVPIQEALVVPDIQIGLGAVVGDEHLAVLERIHGAGIDVQVGIQLLHDDAQPARGEQVTQARGGKPFAERGGDAPGDEDVFRRAC